VKLLSPTDRELLTLLAPHDYRSHSLPEQYGADVLIIGKPGRLGIQRKTVDDLFASLRDGRTAEQFCKMKDLDYAILIREGTVTWTDDGHLMHAYQTRWTKSALRGLMRSVVSLVQCVEVEETESILETAERVLEIEQWFMKGEHTSLLRRPKPAGSTWGTLKNRDYARFFLQSFPGISVGLADAILDHFNRVPVAWDCTLRDLRDVPGIGEKRARAMWKVLLHL
jgi:ERCC4-type nuclease